LILSSVSFEDGSAGPQPMDGLRLISSAPPTPTPNLSDQKTDFDHRTPMPQRKKGTSSP
jgi:hypothetical protein